MSMCAYSAMYAHGRRGQQHCLLFEFVADGHEFRVLEAYFLGIGTATIQRVLQ